MISFSSAANDTIDHLDLSWNHLRNKGACAVALSLKVSSNVLSVNSLQRLAVLVKGQSEHNQPMSYFRSLVVVSAQIHWRFCMWP